MILDDFQLHSIVLQVSYRPAYEIWDMAGEIARELSNIWGDLRIREGTPQQQTLTGSDVVLSTALEHAVVNVLRDRARSAGMVPLLVRTYDVWKELLDLESLTRVSSRSLYVKEFPTLRDANNYLLGLGLVRWPESKVFNVEPNATNSGPDISFRFQDEHAFTVVRFRAETLTFKAELDKDFVEKDIEVVRSRVVIDFDRGNTGSIEAQKLRIDEWLNGYKHLLRRDLPKILGNR